jgi:tetratricopeptide (TPR) repeat protein
MCSAVVRQRSRLSALVLGVSLFAMACGSHYVSRGSALYADGRYVEAAEVFERTEVRLASSSDRERARFGVYRGATFLKLGDVPHAARWLGYARSIVKRDKDALDDDDLALLESALHAVGTLAPREPATKANAEVATAPDPAAPSQ